MNAPGQVLRHILILLGEALRPHRWVVLIFSVLAEFAVLGGLGALRTEDAALGIAVSFMVLTAVVAGTLAGPLVGALAALAGGAIFFATGDSPGPLISQGGRYLPGGPYPLY